MNGLIALISFYLLPLYPLRCSFLYAISCVLDAFDGFAARKLDQSTLFGGVLDMVIDRCTATCILVFLASVHPACGFIF